MAASAKGAFNQPRTATRHWQIAELAWCRGHNTMAVYPLAGGTIYPAGSATPNRLLPHCHSEIWSGKLLEKFYASTVLARFPTPRTKRDQEPRRYGAHSHQPTITINDYLADSAIVVEHPSSNSSTC